ncbi:hypothetical protein SAY87_014187 [Trapa incisa]|uniref:WAT1-related protein n=1 Tax=Trapa incisa TaxID=236973 RepID=A0AAN7GNB7_9MYRT|nr:hypothetical protein SAY87_014187 [Trapa incisa]
MKAVLVMVVVETCLTGANIFYKLAANDGMSLHVIVAYRLLFATAFIVPLALFLERKNRPKLSWTVLLQAFFGGLFGASVSQNLYLESLALTSASYASAMVNLGPAMTFILAISFRLERLKLGTMAGKAKVAGTLGGIGGALLLTIYKGVHIKLWDTHVNLLETAISAGHSPAVHQSSNIILGSLLALSSCLCFTIWLIIQGERLVPVEACLEHPASCCLVFGNSWVWTMHCLSHMVCADARPLVRLSVQPSYDSTRGIGKLDALGRAVAPRKCTGCRADSGQSIHCAVGQKARVEPADPIHRHQ